MSDYLKPLNTKLDAAQVVRRAYDEVRNRIRVDAEVTATIVTVNVIIDAASGDNIKISDGVDTLQINPDGSINVQISGINLSHVSSSVRLGNGTDFLTTSNGDNSTVGLDVNNLNRVFSKPFDEIEVTSKDADGNPLIIISKLNNALMQTVFLTYDIDGDFQKLVVS